MNSQRVITWLKKRKPTKRQLVIATGIVVGFLLLIQVAYPSDRLLPFATIDQQSVGGWQKKDAAWQLNQQVNEQEIPVKRGNESDTYLTSTPAALGMTIDTTSAINDISYPWFMRIVPSSLFWYGLLQNSNQYEYSFDDAKIDTFIASELGNCRLAPQNATLTYVDASLKVVPSENGGKCVKSEVTNAIKALQPSQTAPASLSFPAEIISPTISDEDAESIKRQLTDISKSFRIAASDTTVTIPQEQLLSWLVFSTDGENITYAVDAKKSQSFFAEKLAPVVAIAPGTTRVTTRDFTEIARVEGTAGATLDTTKTRQSIATKLTGKTERATAVTKAVAPRVEFTRTYSSSDAGLSALLQQFAQDNPGTYGIQYIELEGQRRRAGHNESKQFVTASTYKLFVAYSTLKRVESGQWKWNDNVVSGQNLSVCFDKMIVNSDNPCAEALYKKIGYQTVINEVRALGLTQTVVETNKQKTSARDLSILLGSLYSGAIDLNVSSRDRLISAMKRNVYREGIPAGTSGTVANKVGFLDKLLHDASIVYSPKGNYVLVVLTDGSSWAKIAELTRKLESIR